MRRTALLLPVLALGAAAPIAHTAPPALPAPSFVTAGQLQSLTAAGSTAALATIEYPDGCAVRLVDLTRSAPATTVELPPCRDREIGSELFVSDLWLAKTQLAATVLYSPSPHGDNYTYWRGPRPAGPLRRVGDEWGWTDSDVPMGYGCAWAVVAGGGVIAEARVPNRLAVDQGLEPKPACPAGASTTIRLEDAAASQVVVQGSWTPLATDGRRLALAALDAEGRRTGRLSVVDLQGTPLAAARTDPAAVRAAYGGWLTPQGLVLQTTKGLRGPGWRVSHAGVTTVAEGRVLYVTKRTLRVRRVRGGPDRALLTLPRANTLIAAGSFGVAIAIDDGNGKVALYRLPWRVIDRTRPAR